MLIIHAHSPLGGHLGTILTRICALVAHQAATIRPITAPLIALLALTHGRLWRLAHRFDALALRWRAGTLPRPRASRPGRPRPARPDSAQAPKLPTSGRAWLIRLHQPTAQLAGQVEAFLARPDTHALVAAAPQAGRLLRPLCRALGLTPPDYLRLPPRPPRAPRPAQPRTATPPRPQPGTAAAVTWRSYRPGRTRPPFLVPPPRKKSA